MLFQLNAQAARKGIKNKNALAMQHCKMQDAATRTTPKD